MRLTNIFDNPPELINSRIKQEKIRESVSLTRFRESDRINVVRKRAERSGGEKKRVYQRTAGALSVFCRKAEGNRFRNPAGSSDRTGFPRADSPVRQVADRAGNPFFLRDAGSGQFQIHQ